MEWNNTKAKRVLYMFAILGLYNTWGRSAIDGTLTSLLKALHGPKPYTLPGTDCALKTSITGIRWPIDYFLDVLIVFFWQAVDGSHPTTSAIGIYFLGQYTSILTCFYIDSFRLGNARSWKLEPLPWLLAFQLMAAAAAGPWYAIMFLSISPLASTLPPKRMVELSLTPALSTLLLPVSLLVGYIIPASVMALPSPSLVSNGFQQMAVVAWNVFPVLVSLVQIALGAFVRILGVWPESERRSPAQHLVAVRLAYTCALAVSTISHVAFILLGATAVFFPFFLQPEYARVFHPRVMMVPPMSWTSVGSLGDGVRGFMLWDQVFVYATMLFLTELQLSRAVTTSGPNLMSVKAHVLALIVLAVLGPGSVCLVLSWARDEYLCGSEEKSGETMHRPNSVKA